MSTTANTTTGTTHLAVAFVMGGFGCGFPLCGGGSCVFGSGVVVGSVGGGVEFVVGVCVVAGAVAGAVVGSVVVVVELAATAAVVVAAVVVVFSATSATVVAAAAAAAVVVLVVFCVYVCVVVANSINTPISIFPVGVGMLSLFCFARLCYLCDFLFSLICEGSLSFGMQRFIFLGCHQSLCSFVFPCSLFHVSVCYKCLDVCGRGPVFHLGYR